MAKCKVCGNKLKVAFFKVYCPVCKITNKMATTTHRTTGSYSGASYVNDDCDSYNTALDIVTTELLIESVAESIADTGRDFGSNDYSSNDYSCDTSSSYDSGGSYDSGSSDSGGGCDSGSDW